jgi:hypothetical protein
VVEGKLEKAGGADVHPPLQPFFGTSYFVFKCVAPGGNWLIIFRNNGSGLERRFPEKNRAKGNVPFLKKNHSGLSNYVE